MPTLNASAANRLGFAVLGLTNNFAYVIMLSAAYDLLNQSDEPKSTETGGHHHKSNSSLAETIQRQPEPYCNEHSTSTILLADALPSLATKMIYPFLLVSVPAAYKAIGTALLAAAAFLITGQSTSQLLIFTGVVCASLSSGLGEATFLSNTPLYGDISLSGWSIGTGAAGLLGAIAYALLRVVFSIELIMMIMMLLIPVAMLVAYFAIIKPVAYPSGEPIGGAKLSIISDKKCHSHHQQQQPPVFMPSNIFGQSLQAFNFMAKLRHLPSLAKYFIPLLLVYFAEYFINQGLFELIYYPEVKFLDHAAQYRWFQVSYQLGVMISRSSLELIQLKNIWAMALLQCFNAILFLVHAARLIYLPNFYLVIILIVYEGLLGGLIYVNAFYRIKQEVVPSKQEFSISTVTMADSLGIVMAGLAALPVHNALCKLYVP